MSQTNPNPAAKSDQTFWIYLAYLLHWILALIGLAVVKDDDRVRFHCAQAFALSVATFAAWIVLAIVGGILGLIWYGLWVFISIVIWLLWIAYYAYVIIVLVLPVSQGKDPRVPVVADFAEKNIVNWFK